MELILVERELEEPVDMDGLQAMEDKGSWCLDIYQVTHLFSYVSSDGLRTICVYRAPDAEAVRDAQRQLEMPFTRIWSARTWPDGADTRT